MNNDDRKRTSVLRELLALQNMSMNQLREKWIDLYGSDPPQYKKQLMLRRLAYRIQELHYGGLPKDIKEYLQKVAQADPVAKATKKIPEERKNQKGILPGTRFVRIYNNKRYEVITHEYGFEYDGRIFKSLSAIAREITGTRWNGKLFFGVKK